MNFKKLNVRIGVCLSTLFLLSACGGGGGGGTVSSGIAPVTPVTIPVIVPIVQTPFTQADAKPLAGLGLLTVESLARRVLLQQGFFVGFIQGYSTIANPSQNFVSPANPCDDTTVTPNTPGTGTFSISITKAGNYRGLKPNDTIQLNFAGCTFPNADFTLNGQTIVTSAGTYVDSTANSVFSYVLNSNNFNYSAYPSGQQNIYNGAVSVTYDGSTGGFDFPKLAATANGPYSLAIYSSLSALSPTITNGLSTAAGLTYAPTSSGSYTASLNGDVSVTASAGPALLRFVTDTQLSGSDTAGRLVPASGVLRTTDRSANLLTRANVSGSNVTVDFDSNRDGLFDASFTTTYVNLTAP